MTHSCSGTFYEEQSREAFYSSVTRRLAYESELDNKNTLEERLKTRL